MNNRDNRTNVQKWVCALLLAVLFAVVAHPGTFNLVNNVVSVTEGGVPTNLGVAVHAVVFLLLARALMWGMGKLKQ